MRSVTVIFKDGPKDGQRMSWNLEQGYYIEVVEKPDYGTNMLLGPPLANLTRKKHLYRIDAQPKSGVYIARLQP